MAHTYHDCKGNREVRLTRRIRLAGVTRDWRKRNNLTLDLDTLTDTERIATFQRIAHDLDRRGRYHA